MLGYWRLDLDMKMNIKRHDEIWPEMVEMLSDAGLRNYNIFRHGLTLFGYFETDDLQKSIKHIVNSEVNKKWGEYMSDILKAEIDPKTNFHIYYLFKCIWIKMSKARIGVIGAGWWATEYHIPNLKKRQDVELVSVCKLEQDQLDFVKNKFNFQFASTDYNEMLSLSPLDGVVIASPHFAHYENAKAALKKGCHVLIEKPMTTNSSDAEDLFKLAKEVKKEILVPNGFNFTHFMPKAEQYIKDGIIGEIKHIDAAFSSLVDLFQGIPLSESNDHTFKPLASTWSDPNKGGGYGWGQLSHMFGEF